MGQPTPRPGLCRRVHRRDRGHGPRRPGRGRIPAAVPVRQVEQVRTFRVVELQGPGDRDEDRRGHLRDQRPQGKLRSMTMAAATRCPRNQLNPTGRPLLGRSRGTRCTPSRSSGVEQPGSEGATPVDVPLGLRADRRCSATLVTAVVLVAPGTRRRPAPPQAPAIPSPFRQSCRRAGIVDPRTAPKAHRVGGVSGAVYRSLAVCGAGLGQGVRWFVRRSLQSAGRDGARARAAPGGWCGRCRSQRPARLAAGPSARNGSARRVSRPA